MIGELVADMIGELLVFPIKATLFILACIGVIFFFIFILRSNDIIVKKPLVPEIRETCINGVCDTVYIYKNIK